MYYYFPEGFTVGVKTQRAWRKQRFFWYQFFGKSTFWVSTFLPLLSPKWWTHFGVRKQYSTRVSAKQTVSNKISFVSHVFCDKKIFEDDVESRKHEVSFPNLILVTSLFIVERLIHLPTFIFVWNDQNIPLIILSMQISAFFALMLFKSKIKFDEKFWWNKQFSFMVVLFKKKHFWTFDFVTKTFEDFEIHREKEWFLVCSI